MHRKKRFVHISGAANTFFSYPPFLFADRWTGRLKLIVPSMLCWNVIKMHKKHLGVVIRMIMPKLGVCLFICIYTFGKAEEGGRGYKWISLLANCESFISRIKFEIPTNETGISKSSTQGRVYPRNNKGMNRNNPFFLGWNNQRMQKWNTRHMGERAECMEGKWGPEWHVDCKIFNAPA